LELERSVRTHKTRAAVANGNVDAEMRWLITLTRE